MAMEEEEEPMSSEKGKVHSERQWKARERMGRGGRERREIQKMETADEDQCPDNRA